MRKRNVKHKIYFDQYERALRIVKARKAGLSMGDAVKLYGDGANRITVWTWLKRYTDFYDNRKSA